MWDPQWAAWPDRHRLVRLDLPGFGRSPVPAGAYSLAGAVLAELDRRGIERAAVVGASQGGLVGLELAVARPDLVTALVVAGAPLPDHEWSAAVEAFGAEEAAALARGDLDAAVEANLRTWVDGFGRDPSRVDPALRAFVGEMQRRAFALQTATATTAAAASGGEELVPDVGARLGDVHAPPSRWPAPTTRRTWSRSPSGSPGRSRARAGP